MEKVLLQEQAKPACNTSLIHIYRACKDSWALFLP